MPRYGQKIVSIMLLCCMITSCNNETEKNSDQTVLDKKTRTMVYLSYDQQNIYESIKKDFQRKRAAKLYSKAAYFYQNEQFDSSLIYGKAAYEIEPNNKMVLKDIGIAYTNLGKLDSSKQYFKKSIAIDSAYALALSGYGQCLYKQDSNKAAIAYYNRAINHDPNNATYYLNKAIAYRKLGAMDSCCKNLMIAKNKKSYGIKDYVKQLIERYDCKNSDGFKMKDLIEE